MARKGKNKRKPVVVRRKGGRVFPIGGRNNPYNPETNGDNNMLEYLDKLNKQNQAKGAKGDGKGTPVGFQVQVGPTEECWESGIEVIRSCGTAPQAVPVLIGPLAQAKINALMQAYPRIEWLAYLIGDSQNRYIEDIIVPKQEVTAVRVDVDPAGVNVPIIGVIHSHHGMGNGFSGTDHAYINQNHDISLCISHGGIAGQVRVATACGKFVIVKAQVFQHVEGFDHSTFITEAKSLITEKTYNYNTYNRNFPAANRGAGCNFNNSIDRLGMEDSNFNDIETDYGLLGIIDLADSFEQDVDKFPDTFEIIDLVGMKEIIGEVMNPARNYDRFMVLYNNFLDNNVLYDEEDDDFLNPAIELLDCVDTNFKSISQMEKSALTSLWKKLKEAIELLNQVEAEEAEAELFDSGNSTLPTDEELWFQGEECTCHETPCVCITRTEDDTEKKDEWNATPCGDGSEDSSPVEDIEETTKDWCSTQQGEEKEDGGNDNDSDNLWNTSGVGNA